MTTTTDLSEFGFRELEKAAELLTAYVESPPDWLSDGVTIMMNSGSGNVFLTDEDCNVAMMNGDTLEAFLFTPNDGHEGFISDLLVSHDPNYWDIDDVEFVADWAQQLNFELPKEWQTVIDCKDDPTVSDLHNEFVSEILPYIVKEYEQDGQADMPARRETFNNWTLVKFRWPNKRTFGQQYHAPELQ